MPRRISVNLTFEEAHRLFEYSEKDCGLINRPARKRTIPGARAGEVRSNGYRRVWVRGEEHLEHRIVWLMHYGVWPEDQLDHIDQNATNNSVTNLRACNTSENHQNQRRIRLGTSKYTGVCKPTHREGWRAQIVIRKKQIYLGTFRCETAAYVAYCKAKAETHTFVAADQRKWLV